MEKIVFKKKFAMVNGNKLTKKNWMKVVAVSNKPCTGVHMKVIEAAIEKNGAYFEKWKLVYEKGDEWNTGYIFREINHNGGICGHHSTAKKAVWSAISSRITVYIEEEEKND
jgi:hypothetical protein